MNAASVAQEFLVLVEEQLDDCDIGQSWQLALSAMRAGDTLNVRVPGSLSINPSDPMAQVVVMTRGVAVLLAYHLRGDLEVEDPEPNPRDFASNYLLPLAADFADQVDFAIEASEIPRSQVILAGAPLESVSLENGETNVCTDPQRGISVRVFGWFDMRTARRRFRLELLAGLGDPR